MGFPLNRRTGSPFKEPEARSYREVALVPEIREAARSISMTTRDGLRFDGLELDDIIVLLEVRG